VRKVPSLHILLFVLTFFSTLAVGALQENIDLLKEPFQIYRGLPFSLTLLIILLSHEFSHFLASRRHHVDATLPYFIPAPTLFGTLGAFIKMKSPITTKNALVDIGASGPIAGFIVSVAATFVGLTFSKVIPMTEASGSYVFGPSLLFVAMIKMIIGTIPPNTAVDMHPVAFAGWIGFFVTFLNLIPVGQLDGGHIAYAFLGRRHAKLSKVLVAVLVILGVFVYEGWLVWAVLLLILGLRHPPIMNAEIPMDSRRKMVGYLCIAIFILTFTPVPIVLQ
jgi:membrane-associated protease RseP (regulator of RpoE activity)